MRLILSLPAGTLQIVFCLSYALSITHLTLALPSDAALHATVNSEDPLSAGGASANAFLFAGHDPLLKHPEHTSEKLPRIYSPESHEEHVLNTDLDGNASVHELGYSNDKHGNEEGKGDITDNTNTSGETWVPVRHDINPDRSSNTDFCAIVSRYGSQPIPYDTVKACLDTDFPFPTSHRAETAATVKKLLESFYVFEDLVARPPQFSTTKEDLSLSYLPMKLEESIDRLLQVSDGAGDVNYSTDEGEEEQDDEEGEQEDDEEVEMDNDHEEEENNANKDGAETQDSDEARLAGKALDDWLNGVLSVEDMRNLAAGQRLSDRAFHDGISRILAKARDGHLSYDADCFRAFRWQQGFFMSHVVRDDKVVLKVHSVTPSVVQATGIRQDLLNCEVVSIDGLPAADYMQKWADEFVYMSKDANVRFNAALATPQYRPGYADFFIPGKFGERFMLPGESSLAFVFQCSGQSPLEANVKWLGHYIRHLSLPFQDTATYFRGNCMHLGYDSRRDEITPIRSRIEKLEIEQEERTIQELKTRLRDMLIHSTEEVTGNRNMEKDTLPKWSSSSSSDTSSDTPRKITKERLRPELSTYTSPSSQTSTSKDNSKIQESVDEVIKQLDMLSAERLPVLKYYDDVGGRPSELDQSSSKTTFKVLYKGAHDITAIMLADGQTGVITVRTESSTIRGDSYSRVHPAWAGALIGAIDALRPVAKNLILDLSHNTGGYVCLGLTMIQLFFPDRPRLVTNIKLSPLGTQMMSAGAMGVTHFVSSYGDKIVPAYKDGYFLQTVQHPSRNVSFTDYLSDRCAIADHYVLDVDPVMEAKRQRTSPVLLKSKDNNSFDGEDEDNTAVVYRPWNPENMAILTDGYCGSSCALISDMMQTKYNVPTVVVGGRSLAKDKDVVMTYSSFPGLQVIDDSFIFSEMRNVRLQMMSMEELERLEQGSGGAVEFGSDETANKSNNNKAMKSQGVLAQKKTHQQTHPLRTNNKSSAIWTPRRRGRSTIKVKPATGHLDVAPVSSALESDDDSIGDNDDDQEDEDEDDDMEDFYPKEFSHKSRLRLTWRQIYNTGPLMDAFKLMTDTEASDKDSNYQPAWSQVDKWYEYSFLPATHRIDYTDQNIHSIGAIWENVRDAVWGVPSSSPSSSSLSSEDFNNEDNEEKDDEF
ncbi:hypothetical protein BG004_004896 [Podila humilis]|nr:hypothetical protein BG004_004896 [Podila humilis]